jgi:hypothetical protein
LAESARRVGALVVAALALASAVITVPRSWQWIQDQESSFQGLGSPEIVFKYQQLLPEEAVVFVHGRVHAKERYFLLPRAGSAPFAGVDYGTAVRTFARYALLPAVQVQDVHSADVIVGVGADPKRLGLTYAKVDWDPTGAVVVARVKR